MCDLFVQSENIKLSFCMTSSQNKANTGVQEAKEEISTDVTLPSKTTYTDVGHPGMYMFKVLCCFCLCPRKTSSIPPDFKFSYEGMIPLDNFPRTTPPWTFPPWTSPPLNINPPPLCRDKLPKPPYHKKYFGRRGECLVGRCPRERCLAGIVQREDL